MNKQNHAVNTVVSLCLTLALVLGLCTVPAVFAASGANSYTVKITDSARIGNAASQIASGFNQKEDQIGTLRGSGADRASATLYYKTDLSEVQGKVRSATLHITAKVQAGGGAVNFYKVNENWTSTLTDAKRPKMDATPIAVIPETVYSSGNYLPFEIDVTSYVDALLQNGQTTFNIMAEYVHPKEEGTDSRINIQGVAHASGFPYLEITTRPESSGNAEVVKDPYEFDVLKMLAKTGILHEEDQLPGNLNESITRAEFVQYAMRVLNLPEGIEAGEVLFSDVDKNSPYYAAIAAAKQLGVVSGDSEDTFRPDDFITYHEAIKILVELLGYQPYALNNGGYPTGYIAAAARAQIIRVVPSSNNDGIITYNTAFDFIYGALNAPLFEPDSYGSDVTYKTDRDVTLLSEKFDIYRINGIVTATRTASLSGGVGTKNTILIDGVSYNVDDASCDGLLGYQVEAYYEERDTSSRRTIVYAGYHAGENEIFTIPAARNEGAMQHGTGILLSYITENSVRVKQITITPETAVIYNGRAVPFSEVTPEMFDMEAGEIRLVDNDLDGDYEVAFITKYETLVVSSVNLETQTIYDKFSANRNLELDEQAGDVIYRLVDAFGDDYALSDIGEWDVISVCKSLDGEVVTAIVSTESVSGTIEELSDGMGYMREVCVDGEFYSVLSDVYVDEDPYELGAAGEFYLDAFGNIAAVNKTSDVGKLGFVLDAYQDEAPGSPVELTLLVEGFDKTMQMNCRDKLKVDGKSGVEEEEFMKLLFDAEGKVERQGIYFETNAENEIILVDTATKTEDEDDNSLVKRYDGDASGTIRYKSTPTLGGKYPFSWSECLVVYEPEDPENFDEYERLSGGIANDSNLNVDVYAFGMEKPDADIIFIKGYGKTESVGSDSTLSVVSRIITAIDEQGDIYKKLMVYKSGSETGVLVTDKKESLLEGLKVGDVIRYSSNLRGELTALSKYYDYETKTQVLTSGSFNSSGRVYGGAVYIKQDGYIRFTSNLAKLLRELEDGNTGALDTYLDTFFAKDTKGYIYEVVRGEVVMKEATVDDVIDYKTGGADATYAIVHSSYESPRSLIYIKGGCTIDGGEVEITSPYKAEVTDVAVIDISNPGNQSNTATGDVYDNIGTTTYEGVEYDRKMFYKTDLSMLEGKNITSAKLMVYERGMKSGGTLTVQPVLMDWNKNSISYDNAPTVGPDALFTRSIVYESKATEKEIDLTNYVKEIMSGDMVFSIMLSCPASNNEKKDEIVNIGGYNSGHPPYLMIEFNEGGDTPVDPDKYTATFVGGDGATGTAPTALSAEQGETITLPENTFERLGFAFAGWSDGTTVYQPGDAYLMDAVDVVFTAQWKDAGGEKRFTITDEAYVATAVDGVTVTVNHNIEAGDSSGLQFINTNSTTSKGVLYYKVDVGALANVTEAQLVVNIGRINSGGSFRVYDVVSGWEEEIFTPDTLPEIGATPIFTSESYSYNSITGELGFDITAYVQQALLNGQTELKLCLDYRTGSQKGGNNGHDGARIYATAYKNGERAPYIKVVTEAQ